MANVNLKTDFKDGEFLYADQLKNNFEAIQAALNAMNAIVWQDNADKVVTFRGTTEELMNRGIIDGQILYDTSTGESYIDYEGRRISTGSGNAIHIGEDAPTNESTQLWIDEDSINSMGTEVINSLDGNETTMAPSVAAVNKMVKVNNINEAGEDLNNYTKQGIYFFRNNAVTPTNIPAGSNGWLVVLPGNTNNIVKQIWFRFGSAGNHFQTFVRTCLVGTWTEWKEYSITDDSSFQDGDVYKLDNGGYYTGGTVSGSAKSLLFSVNTHKSLKNISNIVLNNLTLTVRKVEGGYLFQGTPLSDIAGNVIVEKINDNTIRFTITMDAAFDTVNNTPVGVCLDALRLTLNK